MRAPILVVVVLFLVLVAIGTFLVYGGQRALPATVAVGGQSIAPAREESRDSAGLRNQVDDLSKRVDALADEIARLRQSRDRVPVQATPTPEPRASELDVAQRDAVYRLIAEDRDRQVVKEKHEQLKNELAAFIATGVPNPQVFPFDKVLELLVDSHLRYCEIRRRLVPAFQDPEADGPWKTPFEQEVEALRASRRSELVKLVGEFAADGCARASGYTFRDF